jgi:anti-anti-sigma factor
LSTTVSPASALTYLHFDISWPRPSTARVAVLGEIDLATAPMLRDWLLGVLRERAPALLNIDLAGVTFLDCAGIGALVCVRNAAVLVGQQVWISHSTSVVRRVLELTGLLDVLTAPIDKPQLAAPGPGTTGPGPCPATAPQPPGLVTAA